MKKFQVTWVEKAYYIVEVEAETFEQAETMVEADFDKYFLGKKPVDFDNETYYEEIQQ